MRQHQTQNTKYAPVKILNKIYLKSESVVRAKLSRSTYR